MKHELTWDDLQPGLRKLEEMLQPSFDEWYIIQDLSHGLEYCERKPFQRVITVCHSPTKILAFCREIHDHLKSRERDQPKIMRLFRAYDLINNLPNGTIICPTDEYRHQLFEFAPLQPIQRENLLEFLLVEYNKLNPTEIGAMRVDGIQLLRKTAQTTRISFFQYTRDIYLTEICETHQFIKDLESAVVYEMLANLQIK